MPSSDPQMVVHRAQGNNTEIQRDGENHIAQSALRERRTGALGRNPWLGWGDEERTGWSWASLSCLPRRGLSGKVSLGEFAHL
jgi:hypothetical protein